MPNRRRLPLSILAAAALLLTGWRAPAARAELKPDELLLIVNASSPESVRLAAHYVSLRNVPNDNVLRIPLPPEDNISFEAYEKDVVPAVRQYFRSNNLLGKVRCLVPVYGVPLRIRPQMQTEETKRELATLQREIDLVRPQIEPMVAALEKAATDIDAKFAPRVTGDSVDELAARSEVANQAIGKAMSAADVDPAKKQAAMQVMLSIYAQLAGLGPLMERTGGQIAIQAKDPAQPAAVRNAMEKYRAAKARLAELRDARWDARARSEVRETVRQNFGLLEYARVVQSQLGYLGDAPQPAVAQITKETTAAFDSELSLLWWDYYPRAAWIGNPLRYDGRAANLPGLPETLMVVRIDGPTFDVAKRTLDDSAKVEAEGLKGTIVLDARTKGGTDGYGQYDARIATLARLLQDKVKMPLIYDTQMAVLSTTQPELRLKNVALYCGWYSPDKYVPAFKFAPGSVGFHVFSFAMQRLHEPPGRGWCSGTMYDGLDATLGPTDEPFLSSFPNPEDFFPLLLTGKLTLAEVYWKSTPMTSWMLTMVGDPLYTPFKKNPMLKPEDLPPLLRTALGNAPAPGNAATAPSPLPTSAPATSPATQGARRLGR